MANDPSGTPIPQPLPVGPVNPGPQPVALQVPQWAVTLVMFFAGVVKNPFLHTVLTVIGSSIGSVAYLNTQLPTMLDKAAPAPLKRLIAPPKKAEDAISQIFFGNSMCTATIIGEVFTTDEYLDVLTAAHCVKLGAKGTMKLKDGRVLSVKCVARDQASDCAWLRAPNPGGDVPYLLLADESPATGENVWHQGYGRDKPGNREAGTLKGVTSDGKQLNYFLSVSPGDSGGAIVLDRLSRVLSPVSCTTKLAQIADVWGATPEACAAIRPTQVQTSEEPPLIYPVLPIPDNAEWFPDRVH